MFRLDYSSNDAIAFRLLYCGSGTAVEAKNGFQYTFLLIGIRLILLNLLTIPQLWYLSV